MNKTAFAEHARTYKSNGTLRRALDAGMYVDPQAMCAEVNTYTLPISQEQLTAFATIGLFTVAAVMPITRMQDYLNNGVVGQQVDATTNAVEGVVAVKTKGEYTFTAPTSINELPLEEIVALIGDGPWATKVDTRTLYTARRLAEDLPKTEIKKLQAVVDTSGDIISIKKLVWTLFDLEPTCLYNITGTSEQFSVTIIHKNMDTVRRMRTKVQSTEGYTFGQVVPSMDNETLVPIFTVTVTRGSFA